MCGQDRALKSQCVPFFVPFSCPFSTSSFDNFPCSLLPFFLPSSLDSASSFSLSLTLHSPLIAALLILHHGPSSPSHHTHSPSPALVLAIKQQLTETLIQFTPPKLTSQGITNIRHTCITRVTKSLFRPFFFTMTPCSSTSLVVTNVLVSRPCFVCMKTHSFVFHSRTTS